MHQSGTGAIDTYYNYLRVTPLIGELDQLGTRWPLENEVARPGYYAATLADTGIRGELTASPRAAFHRYTFPRTGAARIAIDVSTGGIDFDRMRTHPTEAEIAIVGSSSAQGHVMMAGIRIYFCIETDLARSCAIWMDRRPLGNQRTLSLSGSAAADSRPFGIVFDVEPTSPVHVRIGLSLRSVDQARRNLRTVSQLFDDVARETERMWHAYCSRIEISGGTEEQKRVFYSSLYHSLVKPADVSGESPFWEDDAFYVDFATMWDQYKTQLPLMLTLYPERGRDAVKALLSLADYAGEFPNGFVLHADLAQFENQARSLAHCVVADAYYRRLDSIDWQAALKTMVADLRQPRNRDFMTKGIIYPITHTLDLAGACFCTADREGVGRE